MIEEGYKILNEKEKRKLLKTIEKILLKFGIRNYLIYGSFVTRNYVRDIDIAVFGRISDKHLTRVANELESKVRIEIDLRRFDELPEPIKFIALTKGIAKLDDSLRARLMNFAFTYIDFNEWLKKWL